MTERGGAYERGRKEDGSYCTTEGPVFSNGDSYIVLATRIQRFIPD